MTTHFAVIDPSNGEYTKCYNEEERDAVLVEKAWSFFLLHTHNAPYSVVTTNEDGSESWAAPDGTPVLSPERRKAMFEQILERRATIGATIL